MKLECATSIFALTKVLEVFLNLKKKLFVQAQLVKAQKKVAIKFVYFTHFTRSRSVERPLS